MAAAERARVSDLTFIDSIGHGGIIRGSGSGFTSNASQSAPPQIPRCRGDKRLIAHPADSLTYVELIWVELCRGPRRRHPHRA
jgi:hypothetical protein